MCVCESGGGEVFGGEKRGHRHRRRYRHSLTQTHSLAHSHTHTHLLSLSHTHTHTLSLSHPHSLTPPLSPLAQPTEASPYKMPATLQDAHIVNVLGSISRAEVRLAILVEFLVRFTPTDDPQDDLWEKPQWLFEAPLLTFRDEGYATDPVEELNWSLKALRPPYVHKGPTDDRFF